MMPMVHKEVHERTGEDQEPGQRAKNMRRVLRQQEEPRHNKEPAGDDPDRAAPPGGLFVLFVIHGSGSVRNVTAEEIVKGREHCGDVPTPGKAFDEAKEIALPTQKSEPRQKDRQRLMLHGEIRHYQVPHNANHVRDREKRTEAKTQPLNA
jgi:hypothetical protein